MAQNIKRQMPLMRCQWRGPTHMQTYKTQWSEREHIWNTHTNTPIRRYEYDTFHGTWKMPFRPFFPPFVLNCKNIRWTQLKISSSSIIHTLHTHILHIYSMPIPTIHSAAKCSLLTRVPINSETKKRTKEKHKSKELPSHLFTLRGFSSSYFFAWRSVYDPSQPNEQW